MCVCTLMTGFVRATLCTTSMVQELRCTPPTCIVHHRPGAQGGPRWYTRWFCMFVISSDCDGAQYDVEAFDVPLVHHRRLLYVSAYWWPVLHWSREKDFWTKGLYMREIQKVAEPVAFSLSIPIHASELWISTFDSAWFLIMVSNIFHFTDSNSMHVYLKGPIDCKCWQEVMLICSAGAGPTHNNLVLHIILKITKNVMQMNVPVIMNYISLNLDWYVINLLAILIAHHENIIMAFTLCEHTKILPITTTFLFASFANFSK